MHVAMSKRRDKVDLSEKWRHLERQNSSEKRLRRFGVETTARDGHYSRWKEELRQTKAEMERPGERGYDMICEDN